MNKSQTKKHDDLWVKCSPGAIQNVADSGTIFRGARPTANFQRRQMLIGTATAAGVAILGGSAYLASEKPKNAGTKSSTAAAPMSNTNFGGINCREVISVASDFVGKTIDDQGKVDQIEKHLELCEKCRMVYEQRRNS